jgi:hypothetical protein
MTLPLLSKRTRAGMVVTRNRVAKAIPRVPAAVACGIAAHHGNLSKYCMVSASKAPLETNTMVALL